MQSLEAFLHPETFLFGLTNDSKTFVWDPDKAVLRTSFTPSIPEVFLFAIILLNSFLHRKTHISIIEKFEINSSYYCHPWKWKQFVLKYPSVLLQGLFQNLTTGIFSYFRFSSDLSDEGQAVGDVKRIHILERKSCSPRCQRGRSTAPGKV